VLYFVYQKILELEMNPSQKDDKFEQYEKLPSSYHKDPRWQEVKELRQKGEHLKANGIVFSIRHDYGFEG
jgi:hypothetical protein